MNRGSVGSGEWTALRFNEAPIHESGKSAPDPMRPRHESGKSDVRRFNEAPIHESGKSRPSQALQ